MTIPIRTFRDLQVWQQSMDLVTDCYRITRDFPRNEMYGLASQLQRAAVSIPSNIAEGHGRDSTKDYIRHLSIAYASLMELETQVLIAERLQYLNKNGADQLIIRTTALAKMLNALKRSLTRKLDS